MKKRLLILLMLCLFSGLVYAEIKKADKKNKKNGTIWLDANGERINAHGDAGMIHGLNNNTSNKIS